MLHLGSEETGTKYMPNKPGIMNTELKMKHVHILNVLESEIWEGMPFIKEAVAVPLLKVYSSRIFSQRSYAFNCCSLFGE